MKLVWITFLSINLCACQTTTSDINSNTISSADSIALQNEIVHSMEEDLFDNTFIQTNSDTTDIFQEYVCMPRPHFTIKINERNQLMVSGEIDVPIIPRLIKFYTENKKQNDVNNNSPMYSRIDEKGIIHQINRVKDELKEAQKYKKSKNEIRLIEKNLSEWEQRLKALKTLKIKELSEIDRTHVSITGTRNPKVDSNNVLDSVLVGFYLLRDLVAREYFNVSYVSIYKKHKLYGSQNSFDQLEALKILYPVNVFDETKLKKYKNIKTVKDFDQGPPKINVIFKGE
jgi:hypothetical protein